MTVSKYGGLLDMKPRVRLGQRILIVNSFTEEERECRVVYVEPKQRGRRRVAVEFSSADGDFWHVYSPSVRLESPRTSRRTRAIAGARWMSGPHGMRGTR
jgi:hypothetical protein